MSAQRFNSGKCDVLLGVDAYPPWSGGSRVYYDNLYRRLARDHGLFVHVLASHCAGDRAYDEETQTPRLSIQRHGQRLPDWKLHRAPRILEKSLYLLHTAARLRPAALHCGDLFPQDLAGMAARACMHLPLLIFVHGDEISQTNGRRLQPIVRNMIYRAAHAIVAANTYAYERVVAICGSASRITMITPGVDPSAFHPGGRPAWIAQQYGLGDGPVVVTIGRLVRKKGHETVLRSLPIVRKSFPQLKYLIVGGGPEEDRLRQLTRDLELNDCVRFTGDVPHNSLSDFYLAGDVFCMVNQQDASGDVESFGIVFIEAGAAGKPVIGGRSGGTGQSILDESTGFLCEPGNERELAARLILLFQSRELREQMGQAGMFRARHEFNWESRANQLYEVHQSIAAAGQSRFLGRRTWAQQ